MIHLLIKVIIVFLLLLEGLQAQIPRSVYTVNSLGENLSFINLENQAVTIDAKPLGLWTNWITLRNDRAYVVNSGPNEIQVINLATLSTVQRIDVGNGSGPFAIDFVNDSLAAVSLLSSNEVVFVNLNSGQIVHRVAVGIGPEGVKYANGKIYVANTGYNGNGYDPGVVSVIDVTSFTVNMISVAVNPQAFSLDSQGRIFVACTGEYASGSGELNVIDPLMDTVVEKIPANADITRVLVSKADVAYLATYGSGVLVYDVINQQYERNLDHPLPGGPALALDQQDNVYIGDFSSDSVWVFSPQHELLAGYLVGDGPVSIAVFERDPTALRGIDEPQIKAFNLRQNFPNPFNPGTTIQFELFKRSKVHLQIFNLLGEEINSLLKTELPPGSYQYDWSAQDHFGNPVPSGIYFYRLETDQQTTTKKMHLIR